MQATHFPTTPGQISTAILQALDTLRRTQSGGCVNTVRRVPGEDVKTLAELCQAGLPAVLLYYGGGSFAAGSTDGQNISDTMKFRIFCAAGRPRSFEDRWDAGQRASGSATNPGVEELVDWSLYLATRAARDAGGRRVRPGKHEPAHLIEPGLWISFVDLEVDRRLDIYDDTGNGVGTLRALGIVHNPSEEPPQGHLFDTDNETPLSDEPPATAGGVGDL